jgi:predicted lipoprotein with Yx(FWY)xxD motif
MHRNMKHFIPAVLMLAAATACHRNGGSTDTTSGAPATAVVADTAAGIAVAVPVDSNVELDIAAPPGAAVFLVDNSGRAVYTLEDASGGNAKFTGNCTKDFTPIPGHSSAGASDTAVKSSMTGSTAGPNGSKQATYNGKPLYYYNGDRAKGDTKGRGVKDDCGTAHLVNPNGSANSASSHGSRK